MRRVSFVPMCSLLASVGLAVLPGGCARNPVTGKSQLSLVS